MEEIILASASPRRKEILTNLKLPFRTMVPEVDEEGFSAETPEELVKLLAREKVTEVASRLEPDQRRWVLGADTLVVLGDKLLGKPRDREKAKKMLEKISGKVHKVISGVALLLPSGIIDSRRAVTEVKVKKMTHKEIGFYLDTGEWQGAAGGYRIQERGAFFIKWIKGSYSNVVGLPISLFYGILQDSHFL